MANKSQLTLDSLFKYEKSVKKFNFKNEANDLNSDSDDNVNLNKKDNKIEFYKNKILSSSDFSDEEKKIDNSNKNENTESTSTNSLTTLYSMFPNMSKLKIRTIWKKSKFNVKEAIDWIIQEDDVNDNISSENEISSNNDDLSKSSYSSSKSDKKRKLRDEENGQEPVAKKHRKILDSESASDGEDSNFSKNSKNSKNSNRETKKSKIKKNLIKSSSESDKNNEESDEEFQLKKKKKKVIKKTIKEDDIEKDDNEDEDYLNYDSSNSSENSNLSENEIRLRMSVLSFFNNISIEEMQTIVSLSIKRGEILIGLRPFKDYKDLQYRLSENSMRNLLDSVKEILQAREIVNELMNKCEQISHKLTTEMTKLIDKKGVSIDMKTTTLKIKNQPKLLNSKLELKPYQLIGLNWMCLMHSEKINGILADEMGLGKTIQAISFIAFLMETGYHGIHLIVVPPSTLDNWINEIELWCSSINYIVYTGSQEERRHLRYDILENKFEKPLNVMITTYSLISSTAEDKAFFKKIKFDYCVFDEAHMLKNMTSIRYQSLIKITSKRKLLLTGTPLQNNLIELMSLLNFVMPDIFNHRTHHINKLFATKQSGKESNGSYFNEKINQAKGIMKPFILRRLKTEVLQNLPKKHIHVINCKMTNRQLKEYEQLISSYVQRSEEIEKNVKSDKENPANIIMELRKAANHPLLRRSLYNDIKLNEMAKLIMKESPPETVLEYVIEDMSVMSDFQLHKLCSLYMGIKKYELNQSIIMDSGKFQVLNDLLFEKKKQGEKVLIFSQFVIMLDILEEYLKLKEYVYFRLDGSTAVEDRQNMIDEYNKNKEIFIFLLSTKAGGMGINLTSANVVILHDIDYNPFNDKQAEDRCHRVGQTREVEIYKLISKDTIDETMLKIQIRKIELGENLTNESNESQTKSDMVSLLKEALKVKDVH